MGVGKKTAAMLATADIDTVQDLSNINDTCFASLIAKGAQPKALSSAVEKARAAVSVLQPASADSTTGTTTQPHTK